MSSNVTATTNGTQSTSSCITDPTAFRIGYTFALCLIFVVSLIGNALIGIVIYKEERLRKPINFLIVNIAMSDLLFSIFSIPYQIAALHSAFSWLISGPLGQAFCKLVTFFLDVSMYVSIQSLVVIAVDRFVAVVFPLRSPLIGSKRCRFLILATWTIATAFNCPDLIAYKLVEYQGSLSCEGDWKAVLGKYTQYYRVVLLVVMFYFPFVVITVLYLIIVIKVKSQKTPCEQSANAREQRLKRERNVLKMSIAIVSTFAVCWLPFSTSFWFIFISPSNLTMSCRYVYFLLLALLLVQSNCAVNPCICFIFSGNCRQGLKNLISFFLC